MFPYREKIRNLFDFGLNTCRGSLKSIFAISALDTGALQPSIQWSSVSGKTYRVEYSEDLQTWLILPGAENVEAVGDETDIVDTNETADARFYRVVHP